MLLAFAATVLFASQALSEPPRDFVLKIALGKCWNEAIDTTGPTFSRTISPGKTLTATVSLTAEHRRRLYVLVVDADLWGYPSVFKPADETMVEELPLSDFTIEAQANGQRTVIQWLDRGSMRPEAVRLRTMIRAVRALFAERPEALRLPASGMICL
ncbi:MAG: hypothetical protein AB7U83_13985 [Vicinamibacterales bacterium]